MTEKVAVGDFIELDYTGMLTDGTVFDTTEKKVAEEAHIHDENRKFKAAVVCVGQQQLLPGLDAVLAGKEIGTEFTVELSAEKAFGKREAKNMEIIPISTFTDNKMKPQPGLQFDDDRGRRGVITRVSGGRVMVNYNHPLAGREVQYKVKIHRKITDAKEKIISFIHATLRAPTDKMEVEVKENKAAVAIPFQLPEQFLNPLGKKLAELTKLKEVTFSVKKV
jgi:FKBP-type peptidyl-prolyl cis-trans isomerase 2